MKLADEGVGQVLEGLHRVVAGHFAPRHPHAPGEGPESPPGSADVPPLLHQLLAGLVGLRRVGAEQERASPVMPWSWRIPAEYFSEMSLARRVLVE